MSTRYVYYSRVRRVYERRRVCAGRLVGGQPELTEENLGWFILMDDHIAIGVGAEKPDIPEGAWVRQTLEVGEPPAVVDVAPDPGPGYLRDLVDTYGKEPPRELEPAVREKLETQVRHYEQARPLVVMSEALVMAERRVVAVGSGYTGDLCGECGCLTMVRNGTCLKCNTCGATSGCS